MNKKFRVEEAYRNDVGNQIARLPLAIFGKNLLRNGDFIAVKGKRTTYVKAAPLVKEDIRDEIIRIESLIRLNAQVNLDEYVEIEKASPSTGLEIAIVNESGVLIQGNFKEFLAGTLLGKVLCSGDVVPLQLGFGFFGQTIYFHVKNTNPKGPIVFSPETKIKVEGIIEGKEKRKVSEEQKEGLKRISFEDIGGLDDPIRKIREMIELPLRHPELFKQLGISPPKGVLLYGSPGSGKTLLARAVANETSSHFITLNGPEIMSKYYGESENKLREIFEEAEKNAPTIIFIDEIDSIAPKRSETQGEVERRIVAQLLTLMDGMESIHNVVVIAATNRPESIDPALRRGGRFDREIEIGIPDSKARHEILMIHTRGMPIAGGVDLKSLANRTHGYVGADIQSLAREAAMFSLRDVINKLDLTENAPLDPEILANLKVTQNDFEKAMADIVPSAMREVFTEKPNVSWEDIGGLQDIKQELIKSIEWPILYPDVFTTLKGKPPKGILLYGPPGTGKTMLAKAVATKLEANFISIKGPEIFNKYVGESERAIREIFRKARAASPCVIFFDEIDSVSSTRGMEDSSGVNQKVVSQLLIELDGLTELRGVVVLAATNRPDIIDPALRRPGRFDKIIEVSLPDKASRKAIFEAHLRGIRVSKKVDIDDFANRTDHFTGAEISMVVNEARMFAIEEFIRLNVNSSQEFQKSTLTNLMITLDHMNKAMEDKSPSLVSYNLSPPGPSEIAREDRGLDYA